MTRNKNSRYIPALSFKWLTPLYDWVLRFIIHEQTFKRRLAIQTDGHPGERVLDLGCGTGTLTVMLKTAYPGIDLVGLDGDPEVLKIAAEKAKTQGVNIEWKQAMAFALPFPDNSFDKVVTSLMVHHLTLENKLQAFKEVHRVLKPGGIFLLLDLGKPQNGLMKFIAFFLSKMEHAADNIKGLIPGILKDTGFTKIKILERFATITSTLELVESIK
jgi:ubiquinone/menaquinone biosynthesis C-methylase UbiE